MKAIIDQSGCISCGICAAVCPEVFQMGDDGLAEVHADVTDDLKDSAIEARDSCPVSVISLEE